MLLKDRLLSALLAITVTAAATAAITRFTPEKPEVSPAQIEEGITFIATGVPADEPVAIVDGNAASAELLTYQIGYSCSYLDYMLRAYGGEGLDFSQPLASGADAKETILTESLELVKQQLVLENLAERYGVTLSPEQETALAERRAAEIEQLGYNNYLAEIYKLGLSREGYERVIRAEALYQAFYDAYVTPGTALYADDDVLHAFAAGAGYITADHILLMTVDPDTREPLDEAAISEKRALAEDILQQLRRAEDPLAAFDALADEYSEDPGRLANPTGYTFTHGTMVESFDAAARALDDNEISDIVESEYGYHNILRRPMDVKTAADAVRDEYFEIFFTAEANKAEMTLTPAVEQFDVEAVYSALRAAQGAQNEG